MTARKPKPIIFSGPMVRALLSGAKTQTRRVLKPQPEHLQHYEWRGKVLYDCMYRRWCWNGHVGADDWDEITAQLAPFLPYAPGDLLYVKEAWRASYRYDDKPPRELAGVYRAYEVDEPVLVAQGGIMGRYRHARFMPKFASRLTLRVTDVRVQRVQEISANDARLEGIEYIGGECFRLYPTVSGTKSPVQSFASFWSSLYGADAWERNDWICARSFDVLRANIEDVT